MPDFRILHALVDDYDGDGYIRILVNDIVKYIVVDPKTFSYSTTPSRRKLMADLPDIPLGDWTTIRLSRDASDNSLTFHSAERVALPGVEGIWHAVQIDYFDLTFTRSFTHNVYEATVKNASLSKPQLPSVMIAKFARYPTDLQFWTRENEIYAKIQHLNIAPKFLGYITENTGMGSRVIGYLIEKVEGRHATSIDDFPLCRSVLEQFHAATGYVHGDANCNNFMIKPDESGALILDFERAEEEGSEDMAWEIGNFERNMKEDEDAKQEMGGDKWKEQLLRETIGLTAPLSEEDELRRDEVGLDEWIEEKVRTRLREGQ